MILWFYVFIDIVCFLKFFYLCLSSTSCMTWIIIIMIFARVDVSLTHAHSKVSLPSCLFSSHAFTTTLSHRRVVFQLICSEDFRAVRTTQTPPRLSFALAADASGRSTDNFKVSRSPSFAIHDLTTAATPHCLPIRPVIMLSTRYFRSVR